MIRKGTVVNRDLLSHIKMESLVNSERIYNQCTGSLWIVPKIVCIKYETSDNTITVSLEILNKEIEAKTISFDAPLCTLEGSASVLKVDAKARISFSLDLLVNKLSATGTVCYRELWTNEAGEKDFTCLPETTWDLVHW